MMWKGRRTQNRSLWKETSHNYYEKEWVVVFPEGQEKTDKLWKYAMDNKSAVKK